MIKKYFSLLLAGFIQPNSYKKWVILPKKHVVRFFTVSMLLIGLIQGILFSTQEIPKIVDSYLSFQEKIINQYPEDLIVSWKEERLSLLPEDKYKEIDLNLRNVNGIEMNGDGFILYRNDEAMEDEIKQALENRNNFAFITNQKIYLLTEENDLFSQSMVEMFETEDFEVKKEDLPILQNKISDQLDIWVPKIQIILPFIASLMSLGLGFLVSFIFASFMWLLLKISPLTIKKWRQAWQLTLAVLVTVSLIELIIQIIYPQNLTPIRELAFWLISGYVLLSWKFPQFKMKKM
jgi:hypothetical protein